MKKNMFLVVAAVLLVMSSFYGGVIYGKRSVNANQKNSGDRNFVRGQGQGQGQDQGGTGSPDRSGRRGLNPNGGGFGVLGEIVSKDEKSVTVKTKDNSSKIVYFSDSTTVGKSVAGSSVDLLVGQEIMVMGKSGTDGIVTAENIQIREK
jgi:hypothetical protein